MTIETIEVPKELIETIYAIMVGMCMKEELDPNQCGYISSAWKNKKK